MTSSTSPPDDPLRGMRVQRWDKLEGRLAEERFGNSWPNRAGPGRAGLGGGRRLEAVARLAGGSRLASLGLWVPTVHLVDRPAGLAIVEDFPGGT